MKLDWKKNEKLIYQPKNQPQLVNIPAFSFFSVHGKGNPNDAAFGEYISVLYSLAYAVKMSPKQGNAPKEYLDYTVYPLEGVWDLDEQGRKEYAGVVDKNHLVFDLMIRQPDFVLPEYAMEVIDRVKKKKPHPLLDQVRFLKMEEGRCIQMLHLGSYDSEPESFRRMEQFASEQGVQRLDMIHREIYLSDARRVAPDKLKTILRFKIVN
ncbi:MAG: GyrI-like domain-containing protein [Bacteroidales bacterium]